ncbi:MAG TPA: extracellular solute-binding protein [Anaerolineales bacterium]|nr:extracellular solute-binding protein [Anaerolineales bacterium]
MHSKRFFLIYLLAAVILVSCGPAQPTPAATATPAAIQASPTPTGAATQGPGAEAASPLTLKLWLPPDFDPNSNTQASELLRAQLDTFAASHPDVRLEVRVKALEGPGGLLDSLYAASAAAPLALPDLIALPRPLLEAAALKGLVYSYDGLTAIMDQDGWYSYAQQLAHLQSSIFGLPFAGDALVLVYRPATLETPPGNWADVTALGSPLLFSASDPEALFTLALYQSAGGPIQDEQGRPTLDQETLAQVFSFYRQSAQSGVMPYWLTQYETEEQVWAAFADGQASMAVAWLGYYLNHAGTLPVIATAAPIPTADGTPYTLATGWVWALASPDPLHRQVSAELAEHLVDPAFLAQWTPAAGYLPVHQTTPEGWSDASLRSLTGRVALSARLTPSIDLLSGLGSAMRTAVVQVLKQQSDANVAAEAAAAQLNQP